MELQGNVYFIYAVCSFVIDTPLTPKPPDSFHCIAASPYSLQTEQSHVSTLFGAAGVLLHSQEKALNAIGSLSVFESATFPYWMIQ